jgi:glycine dehydrogenase
MAFPPTDRFADRHLGPSESDRARMLAVIGVPTLDALIDQVVPADIRLTEPLALPAGFSEQEYLRHVAAVGRANKSIRSYIGLGYHDTVTPSVILRMVMENPGWYTPYTPYQAEIAQGRLESLINFQTMVTDLTGMEVANASLLDEATAAAEAMTLLHRVRPASRGPARRFLVSDRVFPQTLAVLRGRAEPLGLELVVGPVAGMTFDESVFGALVQYPDESGSVEDWRPFIERAHAAGVMVAVGSDLLTLALLTPPGEMGADVVYGNSQRFGVPLGFGGPHAAFFATRQAFVRQMPGRLIGVSVDAHGQPAYRMSLATREQHIRREKATSNICTAQALLANMAAMYAVYHGPTGLRGIATRVHAMTVALDAALTALGMEQLNTHYFDTLRVRVPGDAEAIRQRALWVGINFRYEGEDTVIIALNETVLDDDLAAIVNIFAEAVGEMPVKRVTPAPDGARVPDALLRRSAFLTHRVFNTHHSETSMMRYVRSLEKKDIGLDTSMIPLGSCTMKLNAAAAMRPVTWDAFANVHPFAPVEQAAGYLQVIEELEEALTAVTGFSRVSLQPNSGAQGELAGLMVIHAYHRARGETSRDVVLIPASAHGTNPASAAMAGLQVVVVATAPDGSVDLGDLEAKAAQHAARLSCLMITYPSTHGVYEPAIRRICEIVHGHGGQVYMDGANMNAQVGLTSPARIGADVCHLNLHKTFSIPHGGGGPGMGPIGVAAHLAPFLPGHPMLASTPATAIAPVAAAPWGSASILLIPYGYIRMLGGEGLTEASRLAILNANYLTARLAPHYPVLYAGAGGRVAHELIFDLRGFKAAGIEESDVAKRLMDFGFHAPTVSFPVAGTLMVEPTESEDLAELDRFCDAMIHIRGEIEAVTGGAVEAKDSPLKHAPHTAAAVSATEWTRAYSREAAAYPVPFVKAAKFWPPVGRIDNPYGDRNLFCSCLPVEA